MRKRGRSRLSSATKRARRFKAKYTADTTAKRAKVLLPVMYPQMEKALIVWDELEVDAFAKFAVCGVPEAEYPYYMAWAKRKAERGIRFDETTLTKELELLAEEFVTRGLDPDKMACIEPALDDWIARYRLRQEILPVDSYGYERNQWKKTGVSPFLDKDDGDTNKIDNSEGSSNAEGDYGFKDPMEIGTLTEAWLYIKGKVSGGSSGGWVDVTFRVWDGSTWLPALGLTVRFYVDTDTDWVIKTINFSSILNTYAKVKVCKTYFLTTAWTTPKPITHITYAYLLIKRQLES